MEYNKLNAFILQKFETSCHPFIEQDGTITIQRNEHYNYSDIDINKVATVDGKINLTFEDGKVILNDSSTELTKSDNDISVDKSIYEFAVEWSKTDIHYFENANSFLQYTIYNVEPNGKNDYILPDIKDLENGYTQDNKQVIPIYAVIRKNDGAFGSGIPYAYAYDGKDVYEGKYDETNSIEWNLYTTW